VKVLGDPGVVKAIVRAGVPGLCRVSWRELPAKKLVEEAKRLEGAGASLLDFRHSGPVAVLPSYARFPSRHRGLGGGRGSTGACASRTPPSAMRRSGSTRRRDLRQCGEAELDAFRALIDDVRSGGRSGAADMPTALIDGIKTNYEVIGNGRLC